MYSPIVLKYNKESIYLIINRCGEVMKNRDGLCDDTSQDVNDALCKWLYGQRVLSCRLDNVMRQTIETIRHSIMDAYAGWSSADSVRLLFELADAQVTVTPYLNHHVLAGARSLEARGWHGRCVVVVAETTTAQVFSYYLRRILAAEMPSFELQVFYSLDNALAWLMEDSEPPLQVSTGA